MHVQWHCAGAAEDSVTEGIVLQAGRLEFDPQNPHKNKQGFVVQSSQCWGDRVREIAGIHWPTILIGEFQASERPWHLKNMCSSDSRKLIALPLDPL